MNNTFINGVKVYAFKSIDQLINHILISPGILVAVNAEKILHADTQTRSIINENIGYCDGIGTVLALKQKGIENAIKIAGCELWLKIVEHQYKRNTSFYFIGGKQLILDKTIEKLKSEYRDINIVGSRNGYITTEQEMIELYEDIRTKKPEIVFVAMGSPKQELIMAKMKKIHPAIYQGLGGSFDVYTGSVKRAPEWWIKHHIEFLYRLIKEPSRITRQIHLLKFIYKLKLKQL